MQEDTIQVSFCDLCGTSVPESDFQSGTAVRHQGKTIGVCCLAALREASQAKAAVGAPVVQAAKGGGAEARLLPVAVVLLAAIAAATIFLDQKLTSLDHQWRDAHEQLLERRGSDSQVLQSMGLAIDGMARKADLDLVIEKVGAGGARVDAMAEEANRRFEALRSELALVQNEVRTLAGSAIDYRPLLDDLRQRQLRMQEVVDALHASPPQPVPVAQPAPSEPGPAVDANALPPALAEQVKKLASTDPATRFEAVDELLRSKNPAVLASLLPLARDPDGFVRRLTVEGLRDFKRAEAVEALLAALQDQDANVADTAWRSLRELTGQKLPFEVNASKDAKARAIQKWAEWWEKNKATFGS